MNVGVTGSILGKAQLAKSIDINAILESLVQNSSYSHKIATDKATQITNTTKITAFSNLKTDVIAVKTSLNTLADAVTTQERKDKLNAFVNAYNKVVGDIKTGDAYNVETRLAGPLMGSREVRILHDALSKAKNTSIDANSLTNMGISVGANGLLTVDSNKVDDALTNHLSNFTTLLGEAGVGNAAGTGLVGAFNTVVNSATNVASGFLTSHIEGLDRQNVLLGTDISNQQRHLDQYTKQQLTKLVYMENSVSKSNFDQQLLEHMFSKI